MAESSRDRSGGTDKCMAAMKEDLSAWMSSILSLVITAETLLEDLETGVVLCKLANTIQRTGEEFLQHNPAIPRKTFPPCGVTYKERTAFRGSFIARDNVANFIRWCRELGVSDIIMFETEDLVLHKNEKSVILTLMEVARRSVKFGLEPPDLVRMENEIDQEIEQQPDEIMEEPMTRLKKKNNLSHSLDDLVYQVLEQCTCPVRFPVLRVAEGKYRMGESKSLIFVRVMRKHVMVRVGGGWDTLERYFDKHDPCKVSERQRRNSIKSPRSRRGSDVIGRSPSSMSISSTDSHDSCGLPVAHGRTASWSSSQTSASQCKSPRDPVRRRMASVSPTRTPSPSSPRLQHRQRRGTLTRDTPPRTIDTQNRGRLSRKSKSMQELTSVVVDGRSHSYSKPTTSSLRKQSVSGESTPTDGTSSSPGAQGQSRRRSLATSPRKSSSAGPQSDSPSERSRLSSSGPVGSPRAGPAQVSRSASFGSRPRPLVPVMEPRSKTMVSSRPTRETQRRASSAAPGRAESRDETRRREPSAKRRSSSATPEGKTRLHGSPKPGQRSAEDKQDRSRKPSVSKIPTPRQKPEQPVTNRKISTESKEHTRGHRSLPSTPRERKSSTTQQNGPNNTVKAVSKNTTVGGKKPGGGTSPSPGRENKSLKQKKELGSTKPNENGVKERTKKKVTKSNFEGDKTTKIGSEETENINGVNSVALAHNDGTSVISNGQPTGPCNNLCDNLDEIDNLYTRDASSPDEKISQNPGLNGGRKMSECSLETDSDFTSDLLSTSDFTDTDYDFKSQRYSGMSETSSDFSFGPSPAWKLFHSIEPDRNALESTTEPDSLELGTSPTVKECLMNLNLQGSVTPTMKRRIFVATSLSNDKEEPPDSTKDLYSQPADKAMFFDVEQYNDKSPDEEEITPGSPRKLSLVQSLISSIEKRSGGSGDAHKTRKNAVAVNRSAPIRSGEHSLDGSAVPQTTLNNHEMPRFRVPPSDELNKEADPAKNGDRRPEQIVPSHERSAALRVHPMVYDINKNVSDSTPGPREISKPQRIPGEKPFEGSQSIDGDIKTRKLSRDKVRRKDKQLDVFPRPQRQFTLEEMIQDMMPSDGESKENEDQRMLSPEPRFQALS